MRDSQKEKQKECHICETLEKRDVKYILLHISGSWLIRVRLVHSWAVVKDQRRDM